MAANFLNSFQMPIVTKGLLIFNIAVHCIIFVTSTQLGYFSISEVDVVQHHQYYRVISAAFVHVGLLHIFMNMSSLVSLGSNLESLLGSLQFLILSLHYIVVVGAFYIALSLLAYWITGSVSYLQSSGVGYSGVLFAYAILEAHHTTETTRSVYGIFNVPAKVYPFILLVLIQLIMPQISLFGHLGGVLCGLASVYGYLNWFNLSQEGYYALDNSRYLSFITSSRGFVRYSSRSPDVSNPSSNNIGIMSAIWYVVLSVWNILMTLLYIIGCPTDSINSTISTYYSLAVQSLASMWASLSRNVQKFCCCITMLRNLITGRREPYSDFSDSDIEENVGRPGGESGISSLIGGGSSNQYHSVSTVDESMVGIGPKKSTNLNSSNVNSNINSNAGNFSGGNGDSKSLSQEELRAKRLERLGGKK